MINLVDNPSIRGSHKVTTIRGGGLIFLIAVIASFFWGGILSSYFLFGLLFIGIVGLVDDIKDVSFKTRLLVQLSASTLIILEWHNNSIFILVLLLPILVGTINAFNFMDGINGITGFYSLAVLFPLLLTENNPQIYDFIAIVIISVIVFLFFNARSKAICFAGDVGSTSIGFICLFLILYRAEITSDYRFFLGFIVYYIDTGFTILERIKNKEKIITPHRKHLYQIFVNEHGKSHVFIAIVFAGIQLLINLLLFWGYLSHASILFMIVLVSIIYVKAKKSNLFVTKTI